jgi:nucleoside phosphorylase
VNRVLVCAATRAEHDACARGIRAAARGGYEVLLTGVGPLRAARSLAERLSRDVLPDLVVSSGFAGALGSTLALSSWITAMRIGEWNGTARIPVEDVELVEGPAELPRCDVVSSSTLVSASVTTLCLTSDGVTTAGGTDVDGSPPLVVDMESAALAREASRHGVPFSVIRLISDTPQHPLPPFLSPFAASMAATSLTTRMALVTRAARSALMHPRNVVQLLRDGPTWLHRLEEGWRSFALSSRSA